MASEEVRAVVGLEDDEAFADACADTPDGDEGPNQAAAPPRDPKLAGGDIGPLSVVEDDDGIAIRRAVLAAPLVVDVGVDGPDDAPFKLPLKP